MISPVQLFSLHLFAFTTYWGSRMSPHRVVIVIFNVIFSINAIINLYGPTVISDCTMCMKNIIDNEFKTPGLVIFANTNNFSTSVSNIRNELLKSINTEIKFVVEVMSPTKEVEVCDQDIEKVGVLHVDHYTAVPLADYFIIIIDSYKDFSSLASKIIRSRSWNPLAKFIILLFNFDNSDKINIDEVEKILSCLFRYNAINIVIALTQKSDYRKQIIYSWKAYDPPTYCGYFNETAKNRLIVENTCERGVLKKNKKVFQYKIPQNMHGCVLKVFALQRQPYMSEDKNDANIEKILINRILKRYNMTATYELIDGFRGERENDGEWNGGLQKLVSKKGHILAGGIFPDFDVHEDFDYSLTYLADAYTWVVPRAPKLHPFVSLLIIFKPLVWYSAITGFFVCAVSWKFIGQLCKDTPNNKLLSHCFINTWICLFGFVAYKRPVKLSLRIFFVFLNLYSVLFLTAYQTKLFDTLTNPSYEYQIQTMEELVDSGLKFGGSEELHDLFLNSSDPLDYYIGENWTEVKNITTAIIDVAVNRNFSVFCSRLELAHLAAILPELSDPHGNYKYYAFPSDMFSVPIEMLALKGFPFMHEFSNTITLFKQSGLNEALRSQYVVFNERRRTRLLRILMQKSHDVNSLSMKHLQGGFIALAMGYIGGFITFILEVTINSNYGLKVIRPYKKK